jgi:ATP-binding cassette, subfamily B, bacterial
VGRTAIIIAHWLSTVRALDRILVFDRGRTVEEGDHGHLLGGWAASIAGWAL